MVFGRRPPDAKPLRLIAEGPDDLAPLAALLQDAVLRVADMAYDGTGRHFTLQLNRFCHEGAAKAALRVPSVVRISGVTRVQARHLDRAKPRQVLSLLDIAAEPLDPPAFAFTLRFAGEAHPDVRIEAECVDVLLLDLAAPHRAKSVPTHF